MTTNSPSDFLPSATLRVNTPMPKFIAPFFEHGRLRPMDPHKRVLREFEDYPVPAESGFGGVAPLIYISCGYATFGVTRWQCTEREFWPFKRAENRTLGCPALIPCSSILLRATSDSANPESIEIVPGSDEHLFVAAMAVTDPLGRAMRVTPLIGRAGAEVSNYFDWQPVLIRIVDSPCDENFSFIRGRDRGCLQTVTDAVQLSTREIRAKTGIRAPVHRMDGVTY
jgi:hypothetical protein